MSLFSSSTLGLPIKLNRESLQRALSHHDKDSDTGRRSSYLRSPGDDTTGEFHVDLLMWELESQIKKYRDVKRQKLVHSQCQGETNGPQAGTSVSYDWLRRDAAPKSRDFEMSRNARREIQELCRKTRPGDLDRLRATFAGVLASREPPPGDVPGIFLEVLNSFLSDSQEPNRKVGKLRAALNLLGSLRHLMRINRVEPKVETEKPLPTGVLECVSPCRQQLFLARVKHSHCIIKVENEVQSSNFALPPGGRQTGTDLQKETGDLETRLRVGRAAWQSSKEDVLRDTVRKPNYHGDKPVQDMDVVDLVSDSSEEALIATRTPASPILV